MACSTNASKYVNLIVGSVFIENFKGDSQSAIGPRPQQQRRSEMKKKNQT